MNNRPHCPSIRPAHAFMGKSGGVSKGVYDSLNCGLGSDDDPENVSENRRIAAQHISGSSETPLLTCYQAHSSTVIEVTSDWGEDRPKADAMVTNKRGIILGVLTADCTPVIFSEDRSGVIGIAHAGWQGAVKGILENTLRAMEKLGAEREKIRAAIGPTIHQESYEVKSDFRSHFADIDPAFAVFFQKGRNVDHYQFDLPGFVASKLRRHGVNHIWNAKVDTYKSSDHFSYRRSTHRRENDYGRQVSGIVRS